MQHEALSVYRAILKRQQKSAPAAPAAPAKEGKQGASEDPAATKRDAKGHFVKVDGTAKGAQKRG